MNRKSDRQFNRLLDEIQRRAPLARGTLVWLRRPGVRLVRLPLALLLVVGGVFSFLPVLGVWMLPLGLLLLAVDIPLLRGPVTRSISWVRWKYRQWRRRRNKK